jgi:hypothetical protein
LQIPHCVVLVKLFLKGWWESARGYFNRSEELQIPHCVVLVKLFLKGWWESAQAILFSI